MLVGDLVALDSELSEHLVEPSELRAWDTAYIAEVEAICAQHAGCPRRTTATARS